jgi:hypothetical protein
MRQSMCIGVNVVIYIQTVMPVFYCALTQQMAVTTPDTTTNATETPMMMPRGRLSVLPVCARAAGVDVVAVFGFVVLLVVGVLVGVGVLVFVRVLVCVWLMQLSLLP